MIIKLHGCVNNKDSGYIFDEQEYIDFWNEDNYFFIAPNINDVRIKRQISSKNNFYWIKWTTEDFFDFLNKEITIKKEIRDELKERGLIALDKLYKEKSKILKVDYTLAMNQYITIFLMIGILFIRG